MLLVDGKDLLKAIDELLTALNREIGLLSIQNEISGADIKQILLLTQTLRSCIDVRLTSRSNEIPAQLHTRLELGITTSRCALARGLKTIEACSTDPIVVAHKRLPTIANKGITIAQLCRWVPLTLGCN